MNERCRIAEHFGLYHCIKTMPKHHNITLLKWFFPFTCDSWLSIVSSGESSRTERKQTNICGACGCVFGPTECWRKKIVSVTSIWCDVANRIHSTTIYRCYFHVMCSFFPFSCCYCYTLITKITLDDGKRHHWWHHSIAIKFLSSSSYAV